MAVINKDTEELTWRQQLINKVLIARDKYEANPEEIKGLNLRSQYTHTLVLNLETEEFEVDDFIMNEWGYDIPPVRIEGQQLRSIPMPEGGWIIEPPFDDIRESISEAISEALNELQAGSTNLGSRNLLQLESPIEVVEALESWGFWVWGQYEPTTIDYVVSKHLEGIAALATELHGEDYDRYSSNMAQILYKLRHEVREELADDLESAIEAALKGPGSES